MSCYKIFLCDNTVTKLSFMATAIITVTATNDSQFHTTTDGTRVNHL